ncbi:MAG: hypothetical protein NTZ21_02585 [Actinobacteria bacterium]|nr:hypothetical protein [Actinomycetota bacterium]
MTAIHRRSKTIDTLADDALAATGAAGRVGDAVFGTPTPWAPPSAGGAQRGPASPTLRELGIDPRPVTTVLFACCAVLTVAGVVAAWFAGQEQWKYQLFELNTEANVPTWFSAVQLAFASLLAWGCASLHRSRGLGGTASWRLVAGALLFVSADEVAQFHEQISFQVRQTLDTDGLLRFAWVIPYGGAVTVLALLLFGWWRSLPAATRRMLVLCAVMFVVGAVGLELVEGAYESWLGKDFGLRALTVLEEALEMFAVAALVGVFLRHLVQVAAMPASSPSAAGSLGSSDSEVVAAQR